MANPSLVNRDRKFVWILVSLYLGLGLVGILNHAMWRDEMHIWLYGRDSASLSELFQNLIEEPHPWLWPICLYILNQFTPNPVAMQILHLLLATGFTYLFVQYSPFTRLQKVLFTFGYYSFFEYLLISRNYAIGILAIFLFCILFESRTQSYIPLALVLGLVVNTNAYALFIGAALAASLVLEYILGTRIKFSTQAGRSNIVISLTIVILSLISSAIQILPSPQGTSQGGLSGWTLSFELEHLAAVISKVWTSHIILLVPSGRLPDLLLFTLISLVLCSFVCTTLVNKPIVLFFYGLSTLEILLFSYFKFIGGFRHYGHLYITLIVAIWIASSYSKSDLLMSRLSRLSWLRHHLWDRWLKFTTRTQTKFLIFILVCQFIAGSLYFVNDFIVPYSASKATATFIQAQNLEEMLIVGSSHYAVAPISGYLNRKIYYPEIESWGSFVIFNTDIREVSPEDVLRQVNQLLRSDDTDVLLILNYELNVSAEGLAIAPLAQFTKSFIHDEEYYLYRVNRTP